MEIKTIVVLVVEEIIVEVIKKTSIMIIKILNQNN